MVSSSDDFGNTWNEPAEGNIKFPKGSGESLNAIWALEAKRWGRVVLAGVDPAAMFRSEDRGETFRLNEALFQHPDRPKWNPGFGGLCLHSILVHPQEPRRMYAAISSGGIYRTDDGGDSWAACVNGLRVHPDVPRRDALPAQAAIRRGKSVAHVSAEPSGRLSHGQRRAVVGYDRERAAVGFRLSAWSRIRATARRSIPFR